MADYAAVPGFKAEFAADKNRRKPEETILRRGIAAYFYPEPPFFSSADGFRAYDQREPPGFPAVGDA
jgi:hypothetical protein